MLPLLVGHWRRSDEARERAVIAPQRRSGFRRVRTRSRSAKG